MAGRIRHALANFIDLAATAGGARLFTKPDPLPQSVRREPTTHDYTDPVRRWGHDITYEVLGQTGIKGSLWSQLPMREQGYLLLTNHATGRSTRYRVLTLEHCFEPRDMYHFTAVFDPRG